MSELTHLNVQGKIRKCYNVSFIGRKIHIMMFGEVNLRLLM